jgi:hypothetical protein
LLVGFTDRKIFLRAWKGDPEVWTNGGYQKEKGDIEEGYSRD